MINAKKSKRNIPIIITGVVILILATILKTTSIGLSVGVMLDILQIVGVIVALIGFGIKWTRKSK